MENNEYKVVVSQEKVDERIDKVIEESMEEYLAMIDKKIKSKVKNAINDAFNSYRGVGTKAIEQKIDGVVINRINEIEIDENEIKELAQKKLNRLLKNVSVNVVFDN